MNHRERAIVALDGGKPDFVPHFEIEFQETAELFAGRTLFGLPGEPDRTGLTPQEINLHNAHLRADIARDLEHSIIPNWKRPLCLPADRNAGADPGECGVCNGIWQTGGADTFFPLQTQYSKACPWKVTK